MQILELIAGTFGVSVTQMIIIAVACVALVVGWSILKFVLKLAMKIFAIGCFTIIVIGVGLYLFFVVLGH